MFAQGPRAPGTDERLVDKVREAVQLAREADKTINDWHMPLSEGSVTIANFPE